LSRDFQLELVDALRRRDHAPVPLPQVAASSDESDSDNEEASPAALMAQLSSRNMYCELFSYERLVADNKTCKIWLGVSSKLLRWLFKHLDAHRKTKHARRDVVSLLLAMRRHQSFRELAHLLDVPLSSFSDRIKSAARRLAKRFNALKTVQFLSLEKLYDAVLARPDTFPSWLGKRAWLFIDGTSLVTWEPKNGSLSRAFYVHYKHHHGLRWTVVCDARGRAVFISPLDDGSIDDAHVWSKVRIGVRIDEHYSQDACEAFAAPEADCDFEQKLCVGADKGYTTLDSGRSFRLVITGSGLREVKKGGRHRGDVTFSNDMAPGRSVSERFFARVKNRHQILEHYDCTASQIDRDMLDHFIVIAASIVNYEIDKYDLAL